MAEQRVLGLLRTRGPLFLEAAFQHVSSDYYILSSAADVTRVFDWFRGAGGTTPLCIDPVSDLLPTARLLVETNTSEPICSAEVARALDRHTLVLSVTLP